MYKKDNNANLIILILIGLLFLVLLIIYTMLMIIQQKDPTESNNEINVVSNTTITKRAKSVQEIIESYETEFIKRNKEIFIKTYVNFKYNLFDENGKSKKQYFYDMIEELVEVEKATFYLIDDEKNIEIYVQYNEEKETYKIIINDVENFYDETNGEIYTNLKDTKIVETSNFSLRNSMIYMITNNNMYYTGTNTEFGDANARVLLENGYYSYRDGAMLAKLESSRIINLILKKTFEEEIGKDIYVTTPLEDIYEKYSKVSFGGIKDGYLGYRTNREYIFFYEDEVSIYASQYVEREEFDKYLSDYCTTGNLEQLYKDFTRNWGNYYELDYNPELQKLKLSYPSRGIEIDIEGNDSRGIKIYNNYYLTETVKELIKSHKITLVHDKDLVHVVEQARRENSK